jgi:predicted RNA-binding protein with PUA-like domain
MARGYWLVKSDPDTFGWDEFVASPDRTTMWDGVRNYQARNFLRDEIRKGDQVLFYHSQQDRAVVGTARVVRAAYPDPTQFDPAEKGFDERSSPENPRWYAVDIKAGRKFARPVTLDALRDVPELADMRLLRRGNRLSVFPVTAPEWDAVLQVAKGRRPG